MQDFVSFVVRFCFWCVDGRGRPSLHWISRSS